MSTPKRDQASSLKSLIGDLEERIHELKLFDAASEVNLHCDELIGQVTLTIESAMEHLNNVQTRMFNEINQYRAELIDASSSREQSKAKEEFKKLWQEFETFKSTAASLDNASVPVVESLAERAHEMRRQMRVEAFDGWFMRFFEKDYLESDLIGYLVETLKDVQDDYGKNLNLVMTSNLSSRI